MKWIALVLITGLTTALTITPAHSQGMVIYPAKGQTPEQQNKDKGECHVWAVQQSGFDPAQAQAPTAPPPAQGGERARGAARGAAAGAAVGAIGGDAGKGAAAGAAAGTVAGGSRKRQGERQQEAQTQQQQAAYAKPRPNSSRRHTRRVRLDTRRLRRLASRDAATPSNRA
jgi:hypothetical protein